MSFISEKVCKLHKDVVSEVRLLRGRRGQLRSRARGHYVFGQELTSTSINAKVEEAS